MSLLVSLSVFTVVTVFASISFAQAGSLIARSVSDPNGVQTEQQSKERSKASAESDGSIEEQILVTATRTRETVSEASASSTVFTEQELERAPNLVVDDLLRTGPGFSLFRRSSSLVAQPTTQGVSLRGIGPSGVSRTLVLLDGVPLNDPFGGWVSWSRVPLASLERVEIVRGGGSNVWGSSALGGVIQLFSAQPRGVVSRVQLEAGERGTAHADASISKRTDRWHGSGHANILDYGGYTQLRADQRGSIDIPTDSEHWQLDGRFGWSPTEAVDLTGRIEHFDEDRSNGTPLTDNQTQLDFLVLGGEFVGGGGSAWSVRAHYQDQEFAARFSAQELDRSEERPALDQYLVASDRLGLSALWRANLGDRDWSHSLVAGFDGRSTEGATNERFFFSNGDFLRERTAGGEERLVGVFLQDNMTVGDRLDLQVGVRFDQWRGDDGFRREFNRSDGSIRLDQEFEDREDESVSPRLGLSLALTDRWRLKGSAYGAFRAPTINELYRPFRVGNDITAANAALTPETLVGAELGVTATFGSITWTTTAFKNRLEDPVANVTIGFGPGLVGPCGFTPGGGSCRQRQNLERTEIEGAETQLRARFQRTTVDLGFLYTDARVDRASNAPDLEGRRLAQVPEKSASIRIDSPLAEKWFTEVGIRYAGEQFEDDLNQRSLASYTVADVGVRFLATEALTLFLRVENAFDEEVEVGRSGTGLFTMGAPKAARLGLRWRLAK